MFYINKITSNHTVDYAAEELKKYLRMMMPEGGDVVIAYNPDAKDGFRLGLMQDFGLDVSDAEDPELDDILYMDCDKNGGIIAGDNYRSVLLAVYEYLRQNGCRWLMPGPDGEFIPMQEIEPVTYRYKPSMRYRGQCNEGAESQQCMLETIEFTPKIGMNTYMLEFKIPYVYYSWYYDHIGNEKHRPPEPVTEQTVLQWKRVCEAEIAKRGLQFHDIGHGMITDALGVEAPHIWAKVDFSNLPAETVEMLAQVDGVRQVYRNSAGMTSICLSNEKARKIIAEYVADYAENHSNITYLHVWLSDYYNNSCECEKCREKRPSDWYMLLMNDIDDALSAKDLDTRIVFIVYYDSLWAPLVDRIKNPKRFALLLAPISRNYTLTLEHNNAKPEPFVLNKMEKPDTLDGFFAHLEEWQAWWKGSVFAYEYHFWWHQVDPSMLSHAERIWEDVRVYQSKGVHGLIEDGSQRSFFPGGLGFYTYARTLYDTSLTFEEIVEEYFSCAYGEDWKEVLAYMEKCREVLPYKLLENRASVNPEISSFYNPALVETLSKGDEVAAIGEALVKKNFNKPYRLQTVSYRLLGEQVKLFRSLAKAFSHKVVGEDDAAVAAFEDVFEEFGRREAELERYLDYKLYMCTLQGKLASKSEMKYVTQLL